MPVRKATLEDIDAILEMEQTVWDDPAEPDTADSWAEYIEYEHVYCCLHKNQIVGAFLATETQDERLCLNKVFIHPDHRGQGLSNRLMEVFTELQIQEVQNAFLYVAANNTNAISLYRRNNFAIKHETDGYYRMERLCV